MMPRCEKASSDWQLDEWERMKQGEAVKVIEGLKV